MTTGESAHDSGYEHRPLHSACERRERRRRQTCDFFCGFVLERTGVHTISMKDGSRACDQGTRGSGFQFFADDRVVEQVLPQETIPESHASLVLWMAGTIFCKDRLEPCDSTLKNDLGQSLVLLISACRGL